MVKRDDLVKFLFSYFTEEEIQKAQKYDTHGANGLQVSGEENVSGVALGVTADLEFFQKSFKAGCNFLLVHHGLRLNDVTFSINEILKKRLEFLFEKNFTLMGFHYLLDSHSKVGNSAVVLDKLGAKLIRPFFDDWGWVGEFDKKTQRSEIVEKCTKIYGCRPINFLNGKKEIKTLAIVSGGGVIYPYSEITESLLEGIDLYVTGEAKEGTQAICREGAINYLAYGHYNTEVVGIKALGEVIQKEFPKLEVKFINVSNTL